MDVSAVCVTAPKWQCLKSEYDDDSITTGAIQLQKYQVKDHVHYRELADSSNLLTFGIYHAARVARFCPTRPIQLQHILP